MSEGDLTVGYEVRYSYDTLLSQRDRGFSSVNVASRQET